MSATRALVLFFLVGAVHSAVITDCGSAGQNIQISVSGCDGLDVCPLVIGTNVTLTADFESEIASNSATVKINGILGGIPVPFPLKPAEACNNWGLKCPLVQGNTYKLQVSMPILDKYPKISVGVRLQLLAQNSEKIICAQFPAVIKASTVRRGL